MPEPVTMDEVFARISAFKENLPGLTKKLCGALEEVINARALPRQFERARDSLAQALCDIRAGMHLIADGANRAQDENLVHANRELCEFLYEVFMPKRDAAL